MSGFLPHQHAKTIAVIGGGVAGSLVALKLSVAKPGWTILLVEKNARLGPGLAYGACGPQHVLNVPVVRMEIGQEPRFADWLRQYPAALAEALEESGGNLGDAFVPRSLFGNYLEQLVARARQKDGQGGIRRVHGQAVAINPSSRLICLDDGRNLDADAIILATGHESSTVPFAASPCGAVIADPWAPGALSAIASKTPVLLVGTGLTMVDTILSLQAQGHTGALYAVSRHGLLPQAHKPGGKWRPVLIPGMSPIEALRAIRAHLRDAQTKGVPWQRIFDAARPAVASTWHVWNVGQQAQFLRHLRAIWDVHRHRMAGRVGQKIEGLIAGKRLAVLAGRILSLEERDGEIVAAVRQRHGKLRLLNVGAVVNCTGPRTDIRYSKQSLLQALQGDGRIRPDPLGLGIDTEDCAVRSADGVISGWLYALGPLTRPAWWEIIAVPEINAQAERLARKITIAVEETSGNLLSAFLDIGAGI